MTAALPRVWGQLLAVVVAEVFFVSVVVLGDGQWSDHAYGVLAAFVLGALGAPATVLTPYFLGQGNHLLAAALLLGAPVVMLAIRVLGHALGLGKGGFPTPS